MGCQPSYTVELFKAASPGRDEEGTVEAFPVISTTTINPSTAAACMQLEQDLYGLQPCYSSQYSMNEEFQIPRSWWDWEVVCTFNHPKLELASVGEFTDCGYFSGCEQSLALISAPSFENYFISSSIIFLRYTNPLKLHAKFHSWSFSAYVLWIPVLLFCYFRHNFHARKHPVCVYYYVCIINTGKTSSNAKHASDHKH